MDERELHALSTGGTVPGAPTDTGSTTAPAGGGSAVPPDSALVGGGAVGDTGSMDDSGIPGSRSPLNDGMSLEQNAPATADTLTRGTSAHPQADGDTADKDTDGTLPTGGLPAGGSTGGAPAGTSQQGLADNTGGGLSGAGI